MKKIYLLLSVVFLLLINDVNAQVEKKALSYKKFSKLNKSLKGSIITYLFLWIDGQYSSDPDFMPDVNKIFEFEKDDAMLVPVRIQQILQDNKQSIQLEKTDSSLTVYYEKEFLMCLPNSFTCGSIADYTSRRNMVKTYDEEGVFFWNEQLEKSFREGIIQIYKKYYTEGYKTVFFPKDTVYIAASERPLVIAYRYDKEKGLSVHKICSSEHTLIENQYTEDLAALAEKYCEQYNLSKIIFAARILRNDDN
jgi:hypothetical protein